MMNYFYNMSDIHLFVLLSCFCVTISIVTIFLVRQYVPYHLRYKDNAVIGNIGSLISIIYGVLAGLSALYLINNVNYTSDAVQREANAVADIYRDSKWLKEPAHSNIQAQTKLYIKRVIEVEWPQMQYGDVVNNDGDLIIEQIANELMLYRGLSHSESLLLHDMVGEVRLLYDARQQRIHMSYTELNPELWIVILIGTVLTLCINYLFGMNFYLHVLTVSAAALMTASMIFLLVTLDRPFQGDFAIEPIAFKDVLSLMDKSGTKPIKNTTSIQKAY